MFFQNRKSLDRFGKSRDAALNLAEGMSERGIVEMMLEKINSLYGGDRIMASFLKWVKKDRNEVFLYLRNPDVEKTSD